MARHGSGSEVPSASPLDLLIIGAGPTGIAALVWAAREGLRAEAIDSGVGPLAQIQGYPDTMAFVSPSLHFEVARLPLDCRDPLQVTRDEVGHYYARLLSMSGGRVKAQTKAVGFLSASDHVQCEVEHRGLRRTVRARNVLVTSWYHPRSVPPQAVAADAIPVMGPLRNPAMCDAGIVGILGGGISAIEQAASLMMSGRSVRVVARGEFDRALANPLLNRLAAATDSEFIARATDIRIGRSGIRIRRAGKPTELPCEVVVACLGMQLREDVVQALAGAGVLTAAEIAQLRFARTPDELLRSDPTLSADEALERALATCPDLADHVFEGRGGIRLAGGILHVGGSHAGVRTSIETARLAVAAISGRKQYPFGHLPLPAALAHTTREEPDPVPPLAVLADLRPVAIRGWTRFSVAHLRENANGLTTANPEDPNVTPYLVRSALPPAAVSPLLATSTGEFSVAELGDRHGMTEQPGAFARLVCHLFRHNGLTWLPPAAEKEAPLAVVSR